MYSACTANRRPTGMSIRQFLSTGLDFCHHLEAHHSIEETYVFPMLARKMPEFRNQEHLVGQHRDIHKGLDLFQEYLETCRSGERELRLEELKEIMDGFGKVLWTHLDDEVRTLGAENMRKYWTLQEMNHMPM
jgi:hemerythrin-like domain-containing protein